MFLGLTSAVLKVTLNHESLNQTLDICILIAAVNNILGDTNLLKPLLAGVVVVGIYNDGGIGEIRFLVKLLYAKQILVVIVGGASAGVVDISAQDRVRIGISFAGDFPTTIDKGVA